MKTQPDDGGPAFACDAGNGACNRGMSLRDWFAGMAIQGAAMYVNEHEDCYENSLEHLGVSGYRIADAMLAARKEQS